jgi:hypothetical protein
MKKPSIDLSKKRYLLTRRKGRKEIQILIEIETQTNWVQYLNPIKAWLLCAWRALRETAFS